MYNEKSSYSAKQFLGELRKAMPFPIIMIQRKSNGYIMTCLNMQTPNQVLSKYLTVIF